MSVVYQSAWPSLRAASTSAASGRYGSAARAGSTLINRRAARRARLMVLPPSAEQIVIDLGPARRLGLEVVRRVHHRLIAALLRLELGDAGLHVRVHRHIIVVAENLLPRLRCHEVDK